MALTDKQQHFVEGGRKAYEFVDVYWAICGADGYIRANQPPP